MNERDQILEKLRKIEALYSGGCTQGERDAAKNAREKILERLTRFQNEEPELEQQFRIPDPWGRKLFVALLRRYSIRPYRYRGQRRTTIVARMPRSFLDQTLWPEFTSLYEVLSEHLNRVCEDIISQSISNQSLDPDELSEFPSEIDLISRP